MSEADPATLQALEADHPDQLRSKTWAFSEFFWEASKRMALTGAVAIVAKELGSEVLRAFAGFMLMMIWLWGAQAIQRLFFPQRPFVDTESRRGWAMYALMMAMVIVLVGASTALVPLLAKGAPLME